MKATKRVTNSAEIGHRRSDHPETPAIGKDDEDERKEFVPQVA